MKKILSKKVSVFGKGIPVFAIVLVGAALVSAALLSYFGVITGMVTVSQGLTIDGLPWDDTSLTYSASLTSLEEKNVSSGNHKLQNTADVVGVVKLNSVCTATGNGCDDVVTYPIFNLSINGSQHGSNPWSVWDRVVTKPGITTVSEINSLTFGYMLTTTAIGNSPYFVLGLDTNDDGVQDTWAVSLQDTGKSQGIWYTHGDSLEFHIPGSGSCTQANLCNLAGVKTAVGTAKILQIKVAIGEWGDMTATTALIKNIKVNNANAIGNGIIVPASSGSTVEGNVDFAIETYFPKMMKPDTYNITTQVLSA